MITDHEHLMTRKHSSSRRSHARKTRVVANVTPGVATGVAGTGVVASSVTGSVPGTVLPNGTIVPPGPPPLDNVMDESTVFFTESGHFEKEQANLYLARRRRERAVMALLAAGVIGGGIYYWKVVWPRRNTTGAASTTVAPFIVPEETSAPETKKNYIGLIIGIIALVLFVGFMVYKRETVIGFMSKILPTRKAPEPIAPPPKPSKKTPEPSVSPPVDQNALNAAEAKARAIEQKMKDAANTISKNWRDGKARKAAQLLAKQKQEAIDRVNQQNAAALAKQQQSTKQTKVPTVTEAIKIILKDGGIYQTKREGKVNGLTFKENNNYHVVEIYGVSHLIKQSSYDKIVKPLMKKAKQLKEIADKPGVMGDQLRKRFDGWSEELIKQVDLAKTSIDANEITVVDPEKDLTTTHWKTKKE